MSITQNEKIRPVTEQTLVVGVDIASEVQWARAFDWRGVEQGKIISFENTGEGFTEFTRWMEELCSKEQKTVPCSLCQHCITYFGKFAY